MLSAVGFVNTGLILACAIAFLIRQANQAPLELHSEDHTLLVRLAEVKGADRIEGVGFERQ